MLKKKFLKIFMSIEVILIFALVGCNNPEPLQTSKSPEPIGDTISIGRGTVGTIGSISIGLGDTGTSDYVDSNGVKQNGLTASLFLFDRIDETETAITVYLGQSFEFHNYNFYVKEIKATHLYPWNLPGSTGGGLIRLIASSK